MIKIKDPEGALLSFYVFASDGERGMQLRRWHASRVWRGAWPAIKAACPCR